MVECSWASRMTGFPGECVRCGGPQSWTYDTDGCTWVACDDPKCLEQQLYLPGCEVMMSVPADHGTAPRKGGSSPYEGGDVRTSVTKTEDRQGAPPHAFLNSLWEGEIDG